MKKYMLLLCTVILAISVLAIYSIGQAQSPSANPFGDSSQQNPAAEGDDSNPVGLPEVRIPAQYQPSAQDLADAQLAPMATVYFTPQDENTSTTVIFLYNTGSVNATVGIQTFRLDGSIYINTSVIVPPLNLVRICADDVSTISGTWQDVVLVNMTTSSTYAKLTIPTDVKAEAYVAWNTSGTFDPLESVNTLPIRFSSDPNTVLMPVIKR